MGVNSKFPSDADLFGSSEPTSQPNYQQASQTGARISNGQPVDRSNYPVHNQGQMQQPNQQRPMQNGQRPMPNGQQMQGNQQRPMQNGQRPMQSGQRPQQGQRPPLQQQVNNGQRQMPNGQQRQPQAGQMPPQPPKPKKKFPIIPVIIVAVVLLIGIGVVVAVLNKKEPPLVAVETNYETSGRFVLDKLQQNLNSYNADELDAIIGTESGDSYLAQEWAYVNKVSWREKFIQMVGSTVTFEYPKVQQMSTTGVGMVDASGQPIMIDSPMNGGETFTVYYPDYEKMMQTMDEDAQYICDLYESSKYTPNDYDFEFKLTNLMLQYLTDKGSFPVTSSEISLSVRANTVGELYIENDAELDNLLFGSDALRAMSSRFSQICLGWTGEKEEYYSEWEELHNDEYDDWYKEFIVYYEQDNGVFNPRTSQWEPFYVRDDKNVIQYDENGEKLVDYYAIIVGTENGKKQYWIQPAETITTLVDKVRMVPDPWIDETGITFTWCGTNYIQNEYQGKSDTYFRVGDGSRDFPAGIGTKIITKVLCTDGQYHDVKVALVGFWTGQDAIDYSESFDTRNRGFTTTSAIKLITFEIYIENLEDAPIEIIPEMVLTDGNSNKSSRTGTIYGFTETQTIQPHKSVIINDWYTSTELDQKYVAWGRSFGRDYPMVFFNVLAGTGYIPPYSAYEYFTGKSSIDGSVNIQNTTDNGQSSTQPAPSPSGETSN